jgi:hypothetical protein
MKISAFITIAYYRYYNKLRIESFIGMGLNREKTKVQKSEFAAYRAIILAIAHEGGK